MTAASLSAGTSASAEFRIGRVLGRSFDILFRHFFKLALLTAIAAVPSLSLIELGTIALGSLPRARGMSQAWQLNLTVGISLYTLIYVLTPAVILYGAFQATGDRRFGIGASLKHGVPRIPAVFGLAVCTLVTTGLGFVLFLVPGMIAGSMFYVAAPACIVEKLGPIASMARSASLTKGRRWRVFSIYLLVGLGYVVSSVVVQLATKALVGLTPAFGNILLVWHALAAVFQAVVTAVAYHDLRVTREGVDVARMAAVFD